MLNYIEYLSGYINIPAKVIIVLAITFLIMQAIGETMEFFGKVAPGFMKVHKRYMEKKREAMRKEREREERDRQMQALLEDAKNMLKETKEFMADVRSHYDDDNIAKRDGWMHDVDEDRSLVHALEKIILKMQEHLLKLRIEAMRSEIIAFATRVVDENCLVTREQYRRIFKLYDDYEKLLAENGMENGEIDTNYRIINESYEHRLVNHSFLEDIRGY